MRILLLLLAALLSASASAVAAQDGRSYPTHETTSNDPVVLATVAEARRTLPAFFARLDGPEHQRSDKLQVRLWGPDGFEDIWVENLVRKGKRFSGTLNNQPVNLPGLQRGSPVEFGPDEIVDWAYVRNGRMWGAFTVRSNISQLGEADAAELRSLLSDTPLEPISR